MNKECYYDQSGRTAYLYVLKYKGQIDFYIGTTNNIHSRLENHFRNNKWGTVESVFIVWQFPNGLPSTHRIKIGDPKFADRLEDLVTFFIMKHHGAPWSRVKGGAYCAYPPKQATEFIEDVLTKDYLRKQIKKWGGVQYTPVGFSTFRNKEVIQRGEEKENIWRTVMPKRRFII